MGHFCCCIPLRPYGVLIGCAQVLGCLYGTLMLSMMDDLGPTVLWSGILFSVGVLICAVFFIVGIMERRFEYMNPYVILVTFSLCVTFIGMCAVAFVSTAIALMLFAGIIATCILFYPIYLLYSEICDES